MSDSIGARLRQARELRHLTLQQVSETTKVRTPYLQALENDDLSAIPSMAQARGFLRIYAGFLELDLASLVPPAPVAAAPVPETAAKPASVEPSRPSLLANLLDRFTRRPTKAAEPAVPPAEIALAPAVEPVVTSPVESEPEPAAVPPPAEAKAAVKTSRRSKPTVAVSSEELPPTPEVKKNAGQ